MNTMLQTTSRPKVLIFDQEASLVEALAYVLLKNGYQPLLASSQAECLDLMRTARPDLVLLELSPPVEEGLEICREICRQSDAPLIMLTTQASEEDCIRGLRLCADDYVVKPFSMGVLLARIGSVLRRSTQTQQPALLAALPPVERGGFVIIPEKKQVFVRGQQVPLALKQFQLLHFLAAYPDCVISRKELIQRVWGEALDREVTPSSVDVYVRQIRQRIERSSSKPRHILTVRGRGYKFSFDDEEDLSQ